MSPIFFCVIENWSFPGKHGLVNGHEINFPQIICAKSYLFYLVNLGERYVVRLIFRPQSCPSLEACSRQDLLIQNFSRRGSEVLGQVWWREVGSTARKGVQQHKDFDQSKYASDTDIFSSSSRKSKLKFCNNEPIFVGYAFTSAQASHL